MDKRELWIVSGGMKSECFDNEDDALRCAGHRSEFEPTCCDGYVNIEAYETLEAERDEAVKHAALHIRATHAVRAECDALKAELERAKGVLDLKEDEYVQQVGTWKITQRLEEERDELKRTLAEYEHETETIKELKAELKQAKITNARYEIEYGPHLTEIDELRAEREQFNGIIIERDDLLDENARLTQELERANEHYDKLEILHDDLKLENCDLKLMAERTTDLLRNYFAFQDDPSRNEWEKEVRIFLGEKDGN